MRRTRWMREPRRTTRSDEVPGVRRSVPATAWARSGVNGSGMSDYTPIDCGIHDHLELTAMRGVPVTVEFVEVDGTPRTVRAARLDTIRIRDGAEYGVFIVADDDGDDVADADELEVRLDRIATVRIPGGRLEIRGARAVENDADG